MQGGGKNYGSNKVYRVVHVNKGKTVDRQSFKPVIADPLRTGMRHLCVVKADCMNVGILSVIEVLILAAMFGAAWIGFLIEVACEWLSNIWKHSN